MIQTQVKPTRAVRKTKPIDSKSEQISESEQTIAPSKLPRTFRRKAIEDSFVHFMQLTTADASPMSDAALKRFKAREIEFIDSDSFYEASAESKILGDHFLGTGIEAVPAKAGKSLSLPAHLARLCEAKLLTPEEEKSVFNRMNFLRFKANALKSKLETSDPWTVRRIESLLKAADWYRDWIVKSNMRLVISIVKKFVNPQNGFDDLLSDGIVALIRAVDKFDVGLGFRFSTYATQVVRRNTYRSVMEKQKDRQRNLGSIQDNGLDISDDQKESSMSEHRWNDLRSRLSLMLDHLDRREKFIIRARFSLGGHRRIQTLQRLADKLGVSKERIRQLEKRALDKLRGMTEAISLPEAEM